MSLADRYRQRARATPPPPSDVDDDVDLVEAANVSFLEAARAVDPRAALDAGLDLRLTGDNVRSGALTFDVASALFHQVQAEVREAVPRGASRRDAELEFVGLGEGSAIVHARPAHEEASEDASSLSASVLDGAVGRVMDLHDALEEGFESTALPGEVALVDRVRQLMRALDRYGINLEMQWTASTGRRRQSAISDRGRDHAREIFKKEEEETTETLAGNVYSTSLDGDLSLRVRRNNELVTVKINGVDKDVVTSLRLDRYIRIEVTKEARFDRAGLRTSSSYKWVRLLSTLEEAESS